MFIYPSQIFHFSERIMRKLTPPTTVERYFSLHYALGHAHNIKDPKCEIESDGYPRKGQQGADTCIARHHNGVCVVCLSPRHPIIKQNKRVNSVAYRVEMRQVKGKRKRGGIVVEEATKLCTLECDDGDIYNVQCAVKGSILEYNTALEKDPQLIVKKPLSDGYLGVVLPWASKIKSAVDDLLSDDDYNKLFEPDQSYDMIGDTK